MNIRDLKIALEGLDEDFQVIISSDAEGNSFHELHNVDGDNISFVIEDRCVELRLASITPEMEEQGFTEEDVDENAAPCVVLWPA